MHLKKHVLITIFCCTAGNAAIADVNNAFTDTIVADSATAITDTAATATAAHKADIEHPHFFPPTPPCYHRHRKNLIVVRETEDTVFVFDKSSIRDAVKNWRRNFDVLRQRSIGLSGSSTYGVYAFSLAPVEELIETDYYLSSKHFDINHSGYEPFPLSGGMGCIGLGQGFRLGGGGMTGERNFASDKFSGDSIIVLGVQISYGGFMVEKAIVSDRWNFTAGGTIGGGAIKVVASEKNSSSWFTSVEENGGYSDFDETFENGNSIQAGFLFFEPHCGFSYTFFHFFHIGVNASLPTFLSVEKFNIHTNDFLSINPGLYLKLIFGNLG
jgi:hypothetical protein